MQPHEPISVFRTPSQPVSAGRVRLNTARLLRLCCGAAALSMAAMIVLIAAEVASA